MPRRGKDDPYIPTPVHTYFKQTSQIILTYSVAPCHNLRKKVKLMRQNDRTELTISTDRPLSKAEIDSDPMRRKPAHEHRDIHETERG